MLAIAVSGALLMLFIRLWILPFHMLNMGGVDQNVVYGTVRILHGEPLYGDPERPPFPIIQYSPLFFYMHALVCVASGIGAEEVQEIYVSGRIFSLILNLVGCWVLFQIALLLGLSRRSAWIASAFYFCSLFMMYYLRPDALYSMVFWLHVWIMVRSDGTGISGRRIWTLAATALLCILAKQSGIIVVVFTALFLIHRSGMRSLPRFIVAFLFQSMIAGALMLGIFGWDALRKNLIWANANGLDLDHMFAHFIDPYGLPTVFFLIIGIILSLVMMIGKGGDPNNGSILRLGFITTLLWGLLTAAKAGSNVNYYNESQMFAVLLLLVFASHYQISRAKALLALPLWLIVLISAVRAGGSFSAVFRTGYYADQKAVYEKQQAVAERIRENGLGKDEYIYLYERSYLELLLAQHTALNAKDILLVSGSEYLMDHSDLYAMVLDGRLKYVITGPPPYSDALGKGHVMMDGMRLSFIMDPFHVHVNERSR